MKKITTTCVVILLVLLSGCRFSESPKALGTLERDRIVLMATANEIIISQPIKEGSMVKKGDLLVQLDNRRQKAKVAMAAAELARAESVWDELRAGARVEDIEAARAKLEGAEAELVAIEKNYQRSIELLRQDLTSKAEVDRSTAERDLAESKVKSAEKALLLLTNGTRKETLDQAEASINAAKAQLELENQALSELSVQATRDGYLDSLPWNEGERVTPGSGVAVLLADSKPYARVYFPGDYRAQMNVGRSFAIQIDGIKTPIKGVLRWISNEPAFTPYFALNESDRSRLVYLAEIDVTSDADLPSGMPVEVTWDAK